MQDEIKLLNEKLDYLNEGSRRLHGLYDKSLEETRNLKNKLDTCENQNGSIFGTRSSNQGCQRIIEGNVHKIWYSCSRHRLSAPLVGFRADVMRIHVENSKRFVIFWTKPSFGPS